MKKIIMLMMVLVSFGSLTCYDGILDNYDDSVVYNLRDRGPAGGWIFYINPNYKTDGWRYLEVAPSRLSSQYFYEPGVDTTTNATDTAVGTGKENTRRIISALGGTGGYAAIECSNYTLNGYSDWFLPSKDEMNLLYLELVVAHVDGSFGFDHNIGTIYWSSSEINVGNAWGQNIYSGSTLNTAKRGSHPFTIRPIRSF